MFVGRPPRALLAALVLAAAAGCSDGGGVDLGEEPGPTAGAAGEGGRLVAAISAEPDRLDPHRTTAYTAFQVLENVYDTLVVPAAEPGEFEPSLATEWSVSEDQRSWTFELRPDVTFHDGSTFDAADVVASYQRIIDEELANAFRFANVSEVSAVDEDTVEIALDEPTPNLLDNIGGFKGMAILPSEVTEEGTELDLDTGAVGTGPFQLVESAPGSVTLSAFEDYWGDGPFVDEVEFRVISEPTTALTALRTGEVQWTDNIAPQQVESLQDDGSVKLSTVPSVDYWYLATNFEREPFDDPAVREAISYGIDREAITEAAKFDAATVNQTAIPEGSFWHSDLAPYRRDPEKARQLLAEAVVSDVSMELMVTDEYPETVTAAQVIEDQLGEIGVDVTIRTEEFATWLDRQAGGDFDAFMLGWLGNLDPFGYYDSQHRCEGPNNYHGYCDPETDQLLDDAAKETDRDERKRLYDEAAARIVDANSYLYLYNPDVVQSWTPDLTGFVTRADRAINFETVRLG